MDPFSLIVGATSLADVCIKYGKVLIEKYRSYQSAELDILETLLRVEHHWLKTQARVEFLHSVWSDLDEQLQVHHNSVLRVLYGKLNGAILYLDQVVGDSKSDDPSITSILSKKGGFRKGKFALKIRECLEKTLIDLATWQEMLDPSWYLMTRVSSSAIDHQLMLQKDPMSSASTLIGIRDELRTTPSDKDTNENIFLATDAFTIDRTSIPFSFTEQAHERNTAAPVIVDIFLGTERTRVVAVTEDVRNLARVLSKIDPLVFGLLVCRGVIKYPHDSSTHPKFELIFSMPGNLSNPASLRGILLQGINDYTLNDRLALAKQMANSVLFIHNAGFVHKNICPETMLVFAGDTCNIQHSFLVGFGKFRPASQLSYRIGEKRWERNLYHHPRRQGLVVEEDFIMQHDIYSLGVCLLEIGLWASFVHWSDTDLREAIPTPAEILAINDLMDLKDDRKRASEIKKILVRMAEEQLPRRMGKKYTEVVVACLTCLDKGNDILGNESDFLDEDGIVVAVRYIEKILMRIKEISV